MIMNNYKKTLFVILFFLVTTVTVGVLSASNTTIYQVKSGDYLQKIADSFNVSVKEIIKLNNIKNPDVIKVGQELKIPADETDEIKYTISQGDTLSEIAKKYGVTKEEIISLNNIKDPNKIYPGENIIIPSESRKEDKNTKKALSRNNTSTSSNTNYIWPVQGKLTSSYGWREHPIDNEKHFHKGIDISLSPGSPIYAVEEGKVTFSGWSEGYGNLIILEHQNNIKTYYAHNMKLLVKEDKKVEKGKIIALSGSSGKTNGPHLHFEIRKNNDTINPMKYLSQQYLKNGFEI
ncbi:MAG: peptidoglycan DD-metalloendopeptidase family protein [Halanaerobiaceae bacterium]